MSNTENVVPSKLYTSEAEASKKRSKEELETEDPSEEQGLAVLRKALVEPPTSATLRKRIGGDTENS